MLFDLSFSYLVRGRLRGSRGDVVRACRATTTVDIRSIEGSHATPVAASRLEAGRPLRDFVAHEDRIYRAVPGLARWEMPAPDTILSTERVARLVLPSLRRADDLAAVEDLPFRMIEHTTREAREHEAQAAARDLLIVDGRLHVRSTEPVLLMSRARPSFVAAGRLRSFQDVAFRLTDRAGVRRWLDVSGDDAHWPGVEALLADLVVTRPDLLEYDAATETTASLVAGIVTDIRPDRVTFPGPAAARRWCDLRDLAETARVRPLSAEEAKGALSLATDLVESVPLRLADLNEIRLKRIFADPDWDPVNDLPSLHESRPPAKPVAELASEVLGQAEGPAVLLRGAFADGTSANLVFDGGEAWERIPHDLEIALERHPNARVLEGEAFRRCVAAPYWLIRQTRRGLAATLSRKPTGSPGSSFRAALPPIPNADLVPVLARAAEALGLQKPEISMLGTVEDASPAVLDPSHPSWITATHLLSAIGPDVAKLPRSAFIALVEATTSGAEADDALDRFLSAVGDRVPSATECAALVAVLREALAPQPQEDTALPVLAM